MMRGPWSGPAGVPSPTTSTSLSAAGVALGLVARIAGADTRHLLNALEARRFRARARASSNSFARFSATAIAVTSFPTLVPMLARFVRRVCRNRARLLSRSLRVRGRTPTGRLVADRIDAERRSFLTPPAPALRSFPAPS
jgi:uncharacterized protein YaaQ